MRDRRKVEKRERKRKRERRRRRRKERNPTRGCIVDWAIAMVDRCFISLS